MRCFYVLFLVSAFGFTSCETDSGESIEATEARIQTDAKARQLEIDKLATGYKKTTSGLRYLITEKSNSGIKPTKEQHVSVHYEGRLTDGTIFDSSYNTGIPIQFIVDIGQVISGWDEGILLLDVGDKATFIIPSNLGYGSRGAGITIPPNATLLFDVELINVGQNNTETP